jgi:hypothetical protein
MTLFTIGDVGSTQEAVISALCDAGITHLLEVRTRPVSRKSDLSKRLPAASVKADG